jgi:2-(1,2-epoxy-1,2-dihydrophenyl)acetyl-CoA isomerase
MTYPEQPTDDAVPSSVLHWRDGAVAHIRFNRPKALNAINCAMADSFLRACTDIANDPAVRCVLVTGEGRAFMAGGDLAEMRTDPETAAAALISGMHGGIGLLTRLKAPVVAAVHGAVAGGGLGLVLNCDFVIAAEGTRFSVAYPLIGASCDCSTSWSLPRLLGLRKAIELVLLGETFDAAEALQMNLVNRVFPASQLPIEATALVQRLVNGPTLALGMLKQLLRASLQNDIDTQLDAEAKGFLACAATSDFREGVEAFLDKRPARFNGV